MGGKVHVKIASGNFSAVLVVSLNGPEMERMVNMHRGGDSQNKSADTPGYPGSHR